jgi:K+ transporter
MANARRNLLNGRNHSFEIIPTWFYFLVLLFQLVQQLLASQALLISGSFTLMLET